MDDPSDNPPSQDELNTQSTNKRGRQATRLKTLTISRNSDQKSPIQFDQSTGVAFGKNSKKFTSYVALLGRSKPSILKENWKQVETHVKEQIWESIMVYHCNSIFVTIIIILFISTMRYKLSCFI